MNFVSLKKQKGAVIILLFVAMIMTITTVFLAAMSNRSPQLRDQLKKQAEMQQIKESLLTYAMSLPDYSVANLGPGRLPCLDRNNDGVMECGTNRIVGRLPASIDDAFLTSPLQLSNSYTGIDQQYWFAVSRDFRQDVASLNTSTHTRLISLNGVTNYAALLIAPGPALGGQERNLLSQFDRYLESTTTNSSTVFLNVNTVDPTYFNDMIVPITVSEVMSLSTLRVAQEMKRVVDYFHVNSGNDRYPIDTAEFNVAVSDPGAATAAWIGDNSWASVTAYTYINDDTATVSYTNCAIVYTFDFAAASISRSPSEC